MKETRAILAALSTASFLALCPLAWTQQNGGDDLPRVNGPWFQNGTLNPYAYNYKGQCTWYVFGRCGEAGWTLNMGGRYGDGYTYYNAISNSGGKDFDPQVGAVMVYPSNLSGSGGHGHVAYVVAVADNDHWTIAQYNYHYTQKWETVAVSRNPSNSHQARQGNDAFHEFLGFVHPPSGTGGTASTVAWTDVPQDGRWYRSDERLVYHVGGDRPNMVKELIDGNATATYDTNDGYIRLSYGSKGWHFYETAAQNAASNGNLAYTGRWNGGWDPDPPTVTRTGGASPGTWYATAGTGVEVTSSDALSGIRRFRYKWDEGGTYSGWLGGTGLTAQLQPGRHHLFVEAEDNAFTGTDELGNRATVDLGEYWLDTSTSAVSVTARLVSSGTVTQIELSVTNPNLSPLSGVGVDLVQFGATKSGDSAWTINDLAGGSTVKKTFSFSQGFGTNKAILLSANYHFGSTKGRLRTRVGRP